MSNNKPIFVLTLVLTGSSKSSLLSKVINHYKLNLQTDDFAKILIDDLVEKNKYFKNAIIKLLKDICPSF